MFRATLLSFEFFVCEFCWLLVLSTVLYTGVYMWKWSPPNMRMRENMAVNYCTDSFKQ